ncbi:MAG: HAD family phosphatase [Ruminococcus sp.]|nr:HAD family phosphatase [Ruminococcus sp.]
MRAERPIKAVIFDLDGTLIDSMGIWYRIDREFLMENGVTEPPEDISERMKRLTVEEAAELFISEFSLPLSRDSVIRRIEELVREEYEEHIALKPCAEELLDTLSRSRIPCGIATATYRSLAEAVLKRHGIRERFDFILTDSEYPMGKCRPDIFLGAASRLGSAPEETLVIEDSLHCIETASAAGFVTAAVYDEASAGERAAILSAADYYFEDLGEARILF